MILTLTILINVIYFFSALSKKTNFVMIGQLTASVLYIFYYNLMALYSPIIVVATNIMVTLVLLTMNNANLKKALTLMSVVIITSYLLIYMNSYYDVLLVFACWAIHYARFNHNNDLVFRVGLILSNLLWLVYASIFDDYSMIITTLLILTSTSFALLSPFNYKVNMPFLKLALKKGMLTIEKVKA